MTARPVPVKPSQGPKTSRPLGAEFSYDNRKGHVGETFHVHGGKGLRNVVDRKRAAVAGLGCDKNAEQFAARFSGPVEEPRPGGGYSFQPSAPGEFDLLIAPALSDGKGRYDRADFNLSLP